MELSTNKKGEEMDVRLTISHPNGSCWNLTEHCNNASIITGLKAP
jgi:hypothetical protein